MSSLCPLCSQPIPEASDQNELQSRIQKLASPALVLEKNRLKEEFESQLVAARKEVEDRLEKEVTKSVRLATRENQAKLEKLQTEREREKVRHEADTARVQGKLDDLSRKLEKQSGEQLGAEAELDLFTELRHAFPNDKIERIGRGVKGADIVHQIMDGTKVAGRIVYGHARRWQTLWTCCSWTKRVKCLSQTFSLRHHRRRALCC